MDEQVVHEIVDELFSSMEPLDTQGAALLQLLKDKGIAGEQEVAGYLEQAGKASNVRWLAARVRIKSLISSAMKIETKTGTDKHSGGASGNAETNGDDPQSNNPVPVAGGKDEVKKESKRSKPDGEVKQAA